MFNPNKGYSKSKSPASFRLHIQPGELQQMHTALCSEAHQVIPHHRTGGLLFLVLETYLQMILNS